MSTKHSTDSSCPSTFFQMESINPSSHKTQRTLQAARSYSDSPFRTGKTLPRFSRMEKQSELQITVLLLQSSPMIQSRLRGPKVDSTLKLHFSFSFSPGSPAQPPRSTTYHLPCCSCYWSVVLQCRIDRIHRHRVLVVHAGKWT